jgi:ABC-type antimicrobial peptide transport system permease subunit
MKWYDLLSLSLTNLWRRKLRSILTLLGVLIGTASIVTMLSIALGQSKAMMDMISQSTDLTTIKVTSNQDHGMPMPTGSGQNDPKKTKINKATIEQLKQIPNVKYVSPILSIQVMIQQGSYQSGFSLEGMTAEAITNKNIHITKGKMPDFSKKQEQLPLIIGRDIINNFHNPNSQMWEPAEVDLINKSGFAIFDVDAYYSSNDNAEVAKPKKYILKADGIIGTENKNSWSPDLYSAFTEIGQLEDFLSQSFRGKAWPGQPATKSGKPMGEIIYNSAIIGTNDLEHTKEIMQQVRDMGFMVESNVEFIDSMRQQSATQQMVLGGIGGISLFVAAIGIANTMMMSVYERTREIGIFKVLGCSLTSIRNIFLSEACLIGLFGGVLGIMLSFLVSFLINQASGESMMALGIYGMEGSSISIIPPWLIFGAILFAMIIGMLAGILPARRAMKLSALEAIRNQ